MNYTLLSNTEMISLTQTWTVTERDVFLSLPKIAPLYDDVVTAHQQVVTVEQAIAQVDLVSQVTRALTETDLRYDDTVRAIFDTMNGAIRFARVREPADEARAKALEGALTFILPQGLRIVQLSHREEAGLVEATLQKLDEKTREVLRSVPLLDATVLDAVLHWTALGRRLGELEAQRSVLLVDQPTTLTAKAARVEWIDIVKQVLDLLKRVQGRDDAVKRLREPVLQALASAKARAARRAATAAKSAGGDEGDAAGAEDGASDDEGAAEIEDSPGGAGGTAGAEAASSGGTVSTASDG